MNVTVINHRFGPIPFFQKKIIIIKSTYVRDTLVVSVKPGHVLIEYGEQHACTELGSGVKIITNKIIVSNP